MKINNNVTKFHNTINNGTVIQRYLLLVKHYVINTYAGVDV
jgi:hypothetical protein